MKAPGDNDDGAGRLFMETYPAPAKKMPMVFPASAKRREIDGPRCLRIEYTELIKAPITDSHEGCFTCAHPQGRFAAS